jgi:hypothetical protein
MVRHTLMALALVGTVGAAVPAVASAASTDRPAVTITIHRVYDPYRRDYHVWNRREREEYREYLAARHRRYVAYERQRAAERRAYWRWRHEREERLEHRR